MATVLRLLCAVAAATAFSPKIVGRISSGGHFLTLERAPFSETMTVEERDAGWECVIPEATSLCDTEEVCDLDEETVHKFESEVTSWLHESAEGGGLEGPPMGTRFFQYDPKADTVSMTVSDANGAFHTLTWPWQSIFMELWARDHVC